ncbi:ATPase family AAA domain-containing protein 2-like isoform X2 [Acanthochromis polyacanthus]|uniref:ATPase family AAA domain-containing protein 2-like isoform X2 n=1 Tax=Acanthochromis polyacanthus TaxID=80966 RepID=UPI0022348754|nr:ATPase family AAA domain-containing protein 2-like isoform X2 [Acanthochromis polyacanthus]
MVTAGGNGKGRGDAKRRSGQLRRKYKLVKTRVRPGNRKKSKVTRPKKSGPSKGLITKRKGQNRIGSGTRRDRGAKSVRTVKRKSSKIQKYPGGRRSGRRSVQRKNVEKKSGPRKSGERKSMQRKSGLRKSDQRKSRQRKSGQRTSGKRKSGQRISGQRKSGQRRSGLRRSTRPTKLTSRYQAPNMFNGISTNTGSSVLKEMENMKKKRHLSSNKEGKIYSKAQRTRTPVPQREFTDSKDGNGMTMDEDSRQAVTADEDSNCNANQSFDAKVSRASSLYQGSRSELLKGTFQISASGPNTSRRGAFRPTKSAWSSQSDEDDEDEKSLNSCHPLGLHSEDLLGTRRDKMASGAGLADIDPMAIDQSVGFDSIGGLSGHISALKEMVVFPFLYPEVFDNFKIQPPRGCLFYGPPGTGKTLVARALANECSHGNRKVTFFMRKGADCLSKWVGESERQLRLLFEQAYQMRPSIIFFDEIDGLAPVRSSRQDQIHSSIVSTLLALMDGLDSRGEVVVIGATNRLDSIDPALRRPGRFDREFLFGLPDKESRKEILKVHTWQWKPPPSEDFLEELAEKCVGYCGADIRAVCTEAALCALRRRYPQIYGTSQKLLLDVSSIAVSSCDFVAAMRKMSPASHRSATSPAKPLSPVVHPLLGAALRDILEALQRLFPHAEQGMKRKMEPNLTSGILDDGLMSDGDEGSMTPSISASSASKDKNFLHFARSAVKQPTSYRPRMLLAGRPCAGQTSHMAPAVLHAMELFTVHSLDSAVLFGVSSTSPEEACAQKNSLSVQDNVDLFSDQVFCEAKRTSPSILYIPHIQQWWDTAGQALRASFLSLLGSIPSFSPILLLATCSVPHQELDPEIQCLFREEYGEVYTISTPTKQERVNFFQDLILNQAVEAPPSKKNALTQDMEILPVAPLPTSRELSVQERFRVEQQEEDVLRELRLFLRNITERLSLDRRFKAFTKPVDIEEFAYKEHIGVDDAILFMLHRVPSHLEEPGVYVRIMFFDFSNAFNSIQPTILKDKLTEMGVDPSCSHTSDFKYSTESCHIQKYSDTAIMACIRNGHEAEYRDLISAFSDWSHKNCLLLNTSKTKEMIIDFHRSKTPLQPVNTCGEDIEVVTSYKYLGVHLDNKLDWSKNVDFIYKKGQSRLFCLRRLRSLDICSKMLQMFYQSVVASVLFYAAVCWGGSIKNKDASHLNKLIKKAGSVFGIRLTTLEDEVERERHLERWRPF